MGRALNVRGMSKCLPLYFPVMILIRCEVLLFCDVAVCSIQIDGFDVVRNVLSLCQDMVLCEIICLIYHLIEAQVLCQFIGE